MKLFQRYRFVYTYLFRLRLYFQRFDFFTETNAYIYLLSRYYFIIVRNNLFEDCNKTSRDAMCYDARCAGE